MVSHTIQVKARIKLARVGCVSHPGQALAAQLLHLLHVACLVAAQRVAQPLLTAACTTDRQSAARLVDGTGACPDSR